MTNPEHRISWVKCLVVLISSAGLLAMLFSGLASGQDRIRAGTITIQRQCTFASQGAVNWGNMTDVRGYETLKVDVVFKINRSNERVRVYELDRASADYKYNLLGTAGIKGDKGVAEMGSPKYEGGLNKNLGPSDGKFTLYLDLLKNTYKVSGKVTLKDVPIQGKSKFLMDIGGAIHAEQEDSYTSKENIQEEISIEGPIKPEDKGVLAGSRNLVPDEIKPFFDALRSLIGGETGGTISWEIRVPMLEIRWYDEKSKEEDKYRDITDPKKPDDQLVGKKIRLRAQPNPSHLKIENPEWTLSGKTIKKFEADKDKSKVIPLGSELKNRDLEFFWADKGDRLEVKCSAKVEGDKVFARSFFNIKKPDCTLTVNAKKSSRMTAWSPGTLGDNCVTNQDKTRIGDNYGLKYYGITMNAETQGADQGRFQYVQLIKEVLVYKTRPDPSTSAPSELVRLEGEGLDTCYPAIEGKNFEDTPAISKNRDVLSVSGDMKFQTFLMFKPKADKEEDSEWVPIQVVPWNWGGAMEDKGGYWDKLSSSEPSNPQPQDTSNYPLWNTNIASLGAHKSFIWNPRTKTWVLADKKP
jgi:hypothetical protein